MSHATFYPQSLKPPNNEKENPALFIGLMLVVTQTSAQSSSIYKLIKELFVAENYAELKITSSNVSPEQMYATKAIAHISNARDILYRLQVKDSISADNYKLGMQIVDAVQALVTKDRRKYSMQLALLREMLGNKTEQFFDGLTARR